MRLIALLLCWPVWVGAATYYATEGGAGAEDGLTPETAWARTGVSWATVEGGGNTLCYLGEITGQINTGGSAGGGSIIDLGCSEGPATVNVSGANAIVIDIDGWAVDGDGGSIIDGTNGIAVAADDVTLTDITCSIAAANCVTINQSASRDNLTITRLTADGASHCVYLNATTASTTFSNITITDPVCTNATQYGIWLVVTAANTTSGLTGIRLDGGTITGAANTNVFIGHQEPNVFNNSDFYAADLNVSGAQGGGGMVVKGFTSSTGTYSADNAIRRITAHDIVGNNGGLNLFYSQYMEVEAVDCDNIVASTVDGACVFLDHGNEDIRSFHHFARNIPGLTGVDNSGMCFTNTTASANITHWGSICHNAKSCYHHGNHPTYTTDSTNINVYNMTCSDIEFYGLFVSQGIDGDGEFTAKNITLIGDGTTGGIGIYQTSVGAQDIDYINVTGFETDYSGLSAGANDLAVDPLLIGGPNPTTAAGFKLSAGSPLRAAGTFVGSLQDYGNRRFKFPPSIGAWEAASGDAAEARTAR